MTVPEHRLFDPSIERKALADELENILRGLPLADTGTCADCQHDGPRRRYLALQLDMGCARRRLVAARATMNQVDWAVHLARLRPG